MSLVPVAIRIRRGRPYFSAQFSSASTAGVVGRPDQLCTARVLPVRLISLVASALPSWTAMLSPNMNTPSWSRT
jgi:hypothetical protein